MTAIAAGMGHGAHVFRDAVQLPVSVESPIIIHGDCIEVLRRLPAESVHVIVTDPPAGLHFMGRNWDDFTHYQPRTRAGRNALRMLTSLASSDATCKALASAVRRAREEAKTATDGEAKRTATAIAKALAATLAEAREALRVEAGDLIDFAGLEPWAAGFVVFLVDVWTEAMRVLKPGAWLCAWAIPRTSDLAGLAVRLAGYDMHESLTHLFGEGMPHGDDISKRIDKAAGAEREVAGAHAQVTGNTYAGLNHGACVSCGRQRGGQPTNCQCDKHGQPATDLARAWHDWNTQLAPGHEQWLLARKPSPLTYAANCVEHGTGALDIGACRVPRGEGVATFARRNIGDGSVYGEMQRGTQAAGTHSLGGWPSNVLLSHSPDCADRCVDGCPALELDRQSGHQHSRGNTTPGTSPMTGTTLVRKMRVEPGMSHDSGGGASRYFPTFRYQAKARRRDVPGRPDLTIDHPTHKHPELMRWLVRLLAAKTEQVEGGAIVLDPFAGSGTTGVACVAEGVRFLGIELNEASVEQARARLAAAVGDPEAARDATSKAPVGAQLGLL